MSDYEDEREDIDVDNDNSVNSKVRKMGHTMMLECYTR